MKKQKPIAVVVVLVAAVVFSVLAGGLISAQVAIPIPIGPSGRGGGGMAPAPDGSSGGGGRDVIPEFYVQPYTLPKVIRVNIVDFDFEGKKDIIQGDYLIDGKVVNSAGEIIAFGRTPHSRFIEPPWIDLVIRKNVPESGDKVVITLYAYRHLDDEVIDINSSSAWDINPLSPKGRALSIDYAVGDEQAGQSSGYNDHWRPRRNIMESDGKIHYKIETIG